MGQKINPISLRLQYTNRNFDNCWYSGYFYQNLITRDILLQHYFNTFLKLLKFDTGRYSIHHLQKNTQIYNFLCNAKSTREWRSTLLGLVKKKNGFKKARYFLKRSQIRKKKFKKTMKLWYFYRKLNQISVGRIQKKITSFQNLTLWSRLVNPKSAIKKTLFSHGTPTCLRGSHPLLEKRGRFPLFLERKKEGNFQGLQKLEGSSWKKFKQNSSSQAVFQVEKPMTNGNRVFLHNLLVYKNLKSGYSHPEKSGGKNFSLLGFNLYFSTKYKNYLENSLSYFYKTPVNLTQFKVGNDWQNARYLADEIVYFLEKRIPFRVIKNKILRRLLKNSQIRGIRITCSGRVGGKSKKAQRAKTECVKYGQTSLQVFSSKLDFATRTAFTNFGAVGVKVWMCYN